MVKARLDTFYTFQVLQKNPFLQVNVHKWEEGATQPHTTYQVFPDGRPGAGMCSCPAYKVCKHTKCVKEAIQDGKINEFWKWQWTEKDGWSEANDF